MMSSMEKERKVGTTEKQFIKEIFSRVKSMEKGDLNGKMEALTKEILWTVSSKAMVTILN